jgi:hypothetical protein
VSELESKLHHVVSYGGKASGRKLGEMKLRLGYRVLAGPDSKPSRVRICPGREETVWKLRSDGEYELESKRVLKLDEVNDYLEG